MARSRPNNANRSPSAWLAGIPLVALGVLACAPRAEAASLGKCSSKIEVVGDALEGNLHENVSAVRNVIITGCDARIEAKLARFTKPDFDDSRWTFEGDVRIRMDSPQGSLSSDKAVVSFRNNQIDRVTITGKPAQFQQKRSDSDATAYGRAGQIIYELGKGTIDLTDSAWVCDGSREMSSTRLQYDLTKQQLNASSTPGGQRVRLTIDPRAASNDPKKVTTTTTPTTGTPITCKPPAWGSSGASESAKADDKRAPAP